MFNGCRVYVTPHALHRYRERVDPAGRAADVEAAVRAAAASWRTRGRGRTWVVAVGDFAAVVSKAGRNCVNVVTVLGGGG